MSFPRLVQTGMAQLTMLLVMLPLPLFSQTPRGWSSVDTVCESACMAAILADWTTTLDVERHNNLPNRLGEYSEANTWLGRHPSRTRVNQYFAAMVVSHLMISFALPKKLRRPFQVMTFGIEASAAFGNYRLGLRLTF